MSVITNCHQDVEVTEKTRLSKGFFAERTLYDIPEYYAVRMESMDDHELPVVGTFIDRRIVPGFRYRVRLNSTKDFLFDGKALKLESIGQGYGKRLTFESEDILENNNFFWSDSNDMGFAFAPQLLCVGEVFAVNDCRDVCIGTFSLENVSEKQQVSGISCTESLVNIEATVSFHGTLRLFPQSSIPLSLCEKEIPLSGSGVVLANRLTSTLRLLEANGEDSKILELLNVQLFVKQVK